MNLIVENQPTLEKPDMKSICQKNALDAHDALDNSLMDAKAAVGILVSGLDRPANETEIPFQIDDLRVTLNSILSWLRDAQDAADRIYKTGIGQDASRDVVPIRVASVR
jgi:hypothetical protein